MNTDLLLRINGWAGHHSILDALMVFCAKYLIFVVFLGIALLMLNLAHKRQWNTIVWFMASLVVSYVLLLVAAHLYIDHRPFTDHHLTVLVNHAAGKSFPSDHTTATTAIGVALVLLTRYKKLGAVIIGAALLIGFARIFVGIHYPIDILGGLIVGTVGALMTWGTKTIVERRRQLAENA